MTARSSKHLTFWSGAILLTALVGLLCTSSGQRPPRGNLALGSDVLTARVEEAKLYEGSYALVIGDSDYTNGWPSLPGVKKDVQKVSAALKQMGFEVELVMNPTQVALDQAMRKFIAVHGQVPNNRLVIYFAGHGWTITDADGRESGYIVPADAPSPDKGDGPFRQVAMDFMLIDMYAGNIASKHALFLFDSCFSGALLDANRGFRIPPLITELINRPVRLYITAGAKDQEVPDSSIFCDQFVEGLKGEADLNDDGYITGSELGMFLEKQVKMYSNGTQTPRWGKIRNQHLDKGDVVFASPRAVAAPTHTPKPVTPTGQAAERLVWIKATESNDFNEYKAYLDKYPDGEYAAEAAKRLARIYFDRGEALLEDDLNEPAEINLLTGLRLQPDSARGHILMAKFLFRRRRLTEARMELTQALRSEPDNPEAHYLLGAAMKEQQHLAEATQELNMAMRLVTAGLQREPNSSLLHGLKSGILHYQGDYRGEETSARRALELDTPGNMRWYERWGAALIGQSKWSEAERMFRSALELKPNSARWHSNLGYVLGEMRRFAEAEPELQKALQLDPKRGQSYVNLGVILSKQPNRWPEAEAAYRRGIELDPENGGLYHHFAQELSNRKRFQEAEPFYRLAAQFDPQNAGQHADLGRNLFRQEKYFQAQLAYSEAVRLDSQNSEYLDQLKKVRARTAAAK